MRIEDETGYREFAAVQLRALQRPAYLLCGDWHTAQDLVQTTLVKMYGAWSRLGPDVDRHAYARRVLVNAYISQRRRHWWRREISTGEDLSELAGSRDDDLGEREEQLALLMTLPPRQRAVIVLRFWEDFSVEQTAQALGIATGTVKSQTSEALKTLRIALNHEERTP